MKESKWSLVRLFWRQADSICNIPDTIADDSSSMDQIVPQSTIKLVTRRLVFRALIVRIFFILAMGTSSIILPDFHSDESVVAFDLRVDSDCFATRGSYCQCKLYRGAHCSWNETNTEKCYLPLNRNAQSRNLLQRHIYPLLLVPLTRWDAARFLRLAHWPQLYHPRLDTSDETINSNDKWIESEQAHAFLPFYPAVIEAVTAVLMLLLPDAILPATCEQTLTLAALIVNTICFLFATKSLFQITLELLESHEQSYHKKVDGDSSCHLDKTEAIHWATRTTLLFIINPANVFFSAAYSESLFCAFVFWGSAAHLLQAHAAVLLLARTCWFFAACIRSNGVLYFGYMFLVDMGAALRRRSTWLVFKGILFLLLCLRLTLQMHNLRGTANHCFVNTNIGNVHPLLGQLLFNVSPLEEAAPERPDWCSHAMEVRGSVIAWPFDLYTHVQRKYWNVGFLRYFALKQLPNFLLAAPIIMIATFGVASWIKMSWTRFKRRKSQRHYGSALPRHGFVRQVVDWAVSSLIAFETSRMLGPSNAGFDDSSPANVLVGSHQLLGHYAVLCAATLLGLFVAHVQITTRLLCSTCPALYWCMTVLVSATNDQGNYKQKWWIGEAVLGYCLLYNLLGIIMHPNWLPWT
ncbi:hypothetical protein MPSEU_000021100 [Mayamaea pseudoterrestris]|nr:hypothetical protein MPSEU_000021100 [Mayamaea pseudoterrestris]